MKKLLGIMILSLLLSGCADYLAERERERVENKRLAYEQQMKMYNKLERTFHDDDDIPSR